MTQEGLPNNRFLNFAQAVKVQAQDVIHFESSISSLRFPQTFRPEQLIEDIFYRVGGSYADEYCHAFFESGLKCEILQPHGKGWKKGRFRLALEFIPENATETENCPDSDTESPQVNELSVFRDSAA